MPKRIQRKRTKGWRMPEEAVYVGRPSRWGNPYRVGDQWVDFLHELSTDCDQDDCGRNHVVTLDAGGAIHAFGFDQGLMTDDEQAEWYAPLRGRDLACWCPLDQPCHADVLLELANGG